MVEHDLAKVGVADSSSVSRSTVRRQRVSLPFCITGGRPSSLEGDPPGIQKQPLCGFLLLIANPRRAGSDEQSESIPPRRAGSDEQSPPSPKAMEDEASQFRTTKWLLTVDSTPSGEKDPPTERRQFLRREARIRTPYLAPHTPYPIPHTTLNS